MHWPLPLLLLAAIVLLTMHNGNAAELTGAELYEGLAASKSLPQLDNELEQLIKETEDFNFFSLANIFDVFRACLFGGEPMWRKKSDLRMVKVDALLASTSLATATLEFVQNIHDVETGVSFSCPEGHATEEMLEIVRLWLEENPAEQRRPATICVINALKAKWPPNAEASGAPSADTN